LRPFDPFANNYFRVRGQSRDGRPLGLFATPGVRWSPPPVPLPAGREPGPLDRAGWFDGSRELDQQALRFLEQGQFEAARECWGRDHEFLSVHNRTLLSHLKLFAQPEDLSGWMETFSGWCDLAAHTNDGGYLLIARQLHLQLNESALRGVSDCHPESVRWSLEVLAAGMIADHIERYEARLLADDLERFRLACATLRQAMLEGRQDLSQGPGCIEREVAPQGEFLISASRRQGPLADEVGRQMALLWRALARNWGDRSQNPPGQVQAMEQALRWAAADLQEELVPELEHLRWQCRPVELRAASSNLIAARRSHAGKVWAGGILCILLGSWLLTLDLRGYSWFGSLRVPRAVVERDLQTTLEETRGVARRLAELNRELAGQSELQSPQSWQRREILRQRHQALLQRLSQLDQLRLSQQRD
jgi:hypothetical protein